MMMAHSTHTPAASPPTEAPGEWTRIAVPLLTGAGSILTAFLALGCCVGPLVLALLGMGGAGLLIAFEPYRPYLTAATIALLGLGFYASYRRPGLMTRNGAAACKCPAPRTNRTGRVVLWVAAALVLMLLASPYVLPLLLN